MMLFKKRREDFRAQDDVLKCFVHNQKNNKFTVTEEERNQKIFSFKKRESENLEFFFFINSLNNVSSFPPLSSGV